MKIIGITGGIGSGKSLVANILKNKYHAEIINTDQVAKEQMNIGGVSYQKVVDCFGTDILSEDGSINRAKLASIVFTDKEKLLTLDQLTHPPVLQIVKEEILRAANPGSIPYLVIETALMIEAGFDYICDEVWYVYAPEEDRRNRLKQERNYTDEKIDSVFERQCKVQEFRAKFPKVVENIGDIMYLEQQIDKLLELL